MEWIDYSKDSQLSYVCLQAHNEELQSEDIPGRMNETAM